MSVPALHARSKSLASDYDQEFFDEEFTLGELSSGERICPPPSGGDGTSVLRALIVIAVAIGGGWAFLHHQPDWAGWLQERLAAMSPTIARQVAQTTPPADITPAAAPVDVVVPPPAPLEPAPTSEIADAPGAATEAAPVTTGSIAPADGQPSNAPLPPPNLDHADRYQKKAAAVGLHPDISRSLLARLSTADYRNAQIAIQPRWPRPPTTPSLFGRVNASPDLALFRVRFVPGAAPECRRYVVTVTKDGWTTTAPPMEKCGIEPAAKRLSFCEHGATARRGYCVSRSFNWRMQISRHLLFVMCVPASQVSMHWSSASVPAGACVCGGSAGSAGTAVSVPSGV